MDSALSLSRAQSGATESAAVRVAGGRGAPHAARSAIVSLLRRRLRAERLGDVALVVSELVTNSVCHANVGPDDHVGVELLLFADRIRLSVIDRGSALTPRLVSRERDEPGGLGLVVVDRLSTTWGVARDGTRLTRTWCELPLEPSQTKGADMSDKKARDVMTPSPTCIGENDSVLDAAKRLAELDVGSLPICGEDDRLKGMLTDRDIVVKVLAQGKDPASVQAGELGAGDGETVTIGADDSIDEALRTMIDHKVRRLPVIDGRDLVGIISQADIATNIDEERVGDLVEAISAAP